MTAELAVSRALDRNAEDTLRPPRQRGAERDPPGRGTGSECDIKKVLKRPHRTTKRASLTDSC